MVSMLQSIKLQPPEEVTNAMETAEVVNVSIEWFPIQCTLRFTFFHRVLIYMLMPIFAVLVPLIYVAAVSRLTPFVRSLNARSRHEKRHGISQSGCAKAFFSVVSFLSGDDLVSKLKERQVAELGLRTSAGFFAEGEIEELQVEIDTLIGELEEAEETIAMLRGDELPSTDSNEESTEALVLETIREHSSEEEDGVAAATSDERDELDTSATREHSSEEEDGAAAATSSDVEHDELDVCATREHSGADEDGAAGATSMSGGVDVSALLAISSVASEETRATTSILHRAFYKVVSESPIALRSGPSTAAANIEYMVQPGDVISAECVERNDNDVNFIKLVGPWGEGWVYDRRILPDGAGVEILLRSIESSTVINSNAGDEIIQPHELDEIRHCFQTIKAISVAKDFSGSDRTECIAREVRPVV